ncbi:MAG TPA: efflux RND transporter periplasmic adaptor subunit [Terracidiphilus sp.]|nr:efflux RND transporter periplasmic adaptor subunit [Terracidiphilus sp.]
MDAQSSASHDSQTNYPGGETYPPVRKRRHRWIWAVVLVLFGLLFYWVLHHEQKSQAATGGGGGRRGMMGGVVPVTTATAHSGSIGVYLDAIGTVTPTYTAMITAQVTGVITAVHYREGQMVRKGDSLIDIDPRPFEATLQQAQGTLERDQNLLAQAQMDYERYKLAWSKNAIPRQTLEDQEKLVAQYQGTIKNDEGLVKYDQVQLGYCHITSPIDGRVGLRLVDPGNLVTANSSTTLVVVTEIQPITVVFTLAEDNLPQVLEQTRRNKVLKVETYDRGQQGHLATGKLGSIDNQIDTSTGTVKLRAEFDNRNGVLFPNQFVNTRLLVNTLENQTLVPSSAIQHNGNTDYVYVLKSASTGQSAAEGQCGEQSSGRQQGRGQANAQGGGQGDAQANEKSDAQHSGGQKGPQQGAAPKAECKVEMTTVKAGNSDEGQTAVQGITPGTLVADSSFEKLQNGSEISISKTKLPTTSDNSASSAP